MIHMFGHLLQAELDQSWGGWEMMTLHTRCKGSYITTRQIPVPFQTESKLIIQKRRWLCKTKPTLPGCRPENVAASRHLAERSRAQSATMGKARAHEQCSLQVMRAVTKRRLLAQWCGKMEGKKKKKKRLANHDPITSFHSWPVRF